jgi:hypothetical protein
MALCHSSCKKMVRRCFIVVSRTLLVLVILSMCVTRWVLCVCRRVADLRARRLGGKSCFQLLAVVCETVHLVQGGSNWHQLTQSSISLTDHLTILCFYYECSWSDCLVLWSKLDWSQCLSQWPLCVRDMSLSELEHWVAVPNPPPPNRIVLYCILCR